MTEYEKALYRYAYTYGQFRVLKQNLIGCDLVSFYRRYRAEHYDELVSLLKKAWNARCRAMRLRTDCETRGTLAEAKKNACLK